MDLYQHFMAAIYAEYDLVRTLKTGARGVVQQVRHRKTGKCYLLRRYTGSCEVYQKLLAVESPHMPVIYEAAQNGEQAVVLEEFIHGDTLAELLEMSCCTQRQTRRIVRQVCEALWVLHSVGAVHRDVKPENVMICGSDAVLIDFDASRLHKNKQSSDTHILGTTGYAAPEQYGLSQSDGRTDIYAVGVMMNIMLTGRHPSIELAGGRLGRVIQRCTMVNPEKRYKDVLQLMRAL